MSCVLITPPIQKEVFNIKYTYHKLTTNTTSNPNLNKCSSLVGLTSHHFGFVWFINGRNIKTESHTFRLFSNIEERQGLEYAKTS